MLEKNHMLLFLFNFFQPCQRLPKGH